MLLFIYKTVVYNAKQEINIMKTLIGFFVFLAATTLYAQKSDKNTLLEPFKIEERLLSGLDIPKQTLKAHPNRAYFQKRIYKGAELSVYILSSETAINQIAKFPIDEFVYYLNGRADIEIENKEPYSFFAGDYIFVPRGFSGKWTNNGGGKYHLELSVISNKRADSSLISKSKTPFLLNRELISGIGLIKNGDKRHDKVLHSGVELEIIIESQIPGEFEISDSPNEQFIHILNGIVTITSKKGEPQTFYKGDFFVLPKGFIGRWKSEGQDMLRILKVIQK